VARARESFEMRTSPFRRSSFGHPLVVSLLVAGAAAATSAARPHEPVAASASSEPAAGGSLEAALETVSADEIKADIFFIASDELEGRDTISQGQRVAARYLRSRLQRLGIPPGAKEGYFYEYPLRTQKVEAKESVTRWTSADRKVELEFGRDWFAASKDFRSLSVEGGVVFVGKGSPSDFRKRSVEGKWVLVLDDGGLVGDVERLVVESKALGALMTPAPDAKVEPYERRFAKEVRTLSRSTVQWPDSSRRDAASPRGGNAGAGEKGSSEASAGSRRDKGPAPLFVWLTPAAASSILPELGEGKLPQAGAELTGTLSHTRKLAGNDGEVMAENVCGFWEGSDPELRKEVIIVSAHYDHVGYGGGTQIHNGADDNGSGTCGMLALAEALTVQGPLRRSVLLLWVSGEEKGLWGSKAWTESPWLPEGHRAICDINIDMIGRNAPDFLMITPTSARPEYNGLVRLAEKLAPMEGFPKLESCDSYWSRSDHANFAQNLGIPVTFLFSDVHADYHKPTDDPEKIDCDKIRRVVRLVLRMIAGLQEAPLDLK
jgi:hypothetical protein